jgi:phosphopantetheine adenylyltransferase
MLTDFIDSLGYDVTLVRGLRNSIDLQYELTQFQYMQEFKPDIKIVSIFCDKEFEHISSSSIRMLEKYGKADSYYL